MHRINVRWANVNLTLRNFKHYLWQCPSSALKVKPQYFGIVKNKALKVQHFCKSSPLIFDLICFAHGFVFAEKIDYIRISAVSLTPLKRFQWWQSEKCHKDINYRIFCCRISAVPMTPLKRFLRCHWYRWNRFRRLWKRLSRRLMKKPRVENLVQLSL
jgi:hypothetical protein